MQHYRVEPRIMVGVRYEFDVMNYVELGLEGLSDKLIAMTLPFVTKISFMYGRYTVGRQFSVITSESA